MSFDMFAASQRGSKWSWCRWETKRYSASRIPAGSASEPKAELSGKGNHDAKYAGVNHGSQTIRPAAVSTSMPA